MRVVFAGTPAAAVPSLQALLASRHEVVGVMTRADARAGRGRTLRPSPVRELADEAGLPVLTPTSLRDEEARAQLRDWAPDACPVVAYGLLVPPGDAAALSEALITLAQEPDRLALMGEAARARVLDGFTERDVMESVKELYRCMLAS